MAIGFFPAVDPVEQAKNPDYAAYLRKLIAAERMARSKQPIKHWAQGASQLAHSLADRYELGKIAEGEKAGNAEFTKALVAALGGAPASVTPGLSSAAVPGAAPAAAPPSPAAGATHPYSAPNDKYFGPYTPDLAPGAIEMLKARATGGAAARPNSFNGIQPELAVRTASMLGNLPPDARITSGFRDPATNAAVGGAKHSQHMGGNAFDIAFSDPATKQAIIQAAQGQGLRTLANYPGHVHVDGKSPGMAAPGPVAGQAPAAPGGNNAAALAMLANPAIAARLQKNPLMAALLAKKLSDGKVSYQTLPDGTILALDPMGRQSPRVVFQGPQKPVSLSEGATLVDPKTGRTIAAGRAKDDRTADQKNYQAYVRGLPQGEKALPFGAWAERMKRAGSAAPESAFAVANAKNMAEAYKGIAEEGNSARTDIATIKTLREQFNKIPGGFLGHMQGALSRYGIKLPGATSIEVADALINRLTPQMRQGMPGAASDRDVAMFRGSLPSLMNTQDGRKVILDTMEALAQYKSARGRIAMQVQMGRMSPQDGMVQMEKLADPFALFKNMQKGASTPKSDILKEADKIVNGMP